MPGTVLRAKDTVVNEKTKISDLKNVLIGVDTKICRTPDDDMMYRKK